MDFTVSDLVEKIFDLNALDNAADGATWFVVGIAAALAPLLYVASFVYNFATTTIKNVGDRPKFFDKAELIRGLVIWFMIGSYPFIFGTVERLAGVAVTSSQPGQYAEWKMNHGETVYPENESQSKDDIEQGTEKPKGESSDSEGPGALDIAGQLQAALIGWFQSSLAAIAFSISIVVTGLSLIIGKLLYVIGPLALAFSILPGFKDKLNKWFGTWLLCLLNPLTVNVLNTIMLELSFEIFSNAAGADTTMTAGIGVIIMSLIVIVCYILTFWITSQFVGSPDAGKILSTAATGVQMGAGLVGGGASGGASVAAGAAGKGGSVGDVVDSGKPS